MRFQLSRMETGLLQWHLGRPIDVVINDTDWRVQLLSGGEGVEYTPLDFASADASHPHATVTRLMAERPDEIFREPVQLRDFGVVRRVSVFTVGVSFSLPRETPNGTTYAIVYSDPRSEAADVRVVDAGILFETDQRGLLVHTDGVTVWAQASIDPAGVMQRIFRGHGRLTPLHS